MNERTFKTYVKSGMRNRWKHQSIETGGTGQGVPDSYFSLPKVGGWIEFKFHNLWPKKPDTIVRIKNYKRFINQRNWIWKHGQLTGSTFFFIKIEKDYLLFDYKGTMELNNLTKKGMFRYCIGHWHNRVNFVQLTELLLKDYRKISIGVEK